MNAAVPEHAEMIEVLSEVEPPLSKQPSERHPSFSGKIRSEDGNIRVKSHFVT